LERRQAIAENYKTWSIEQLEHAYGQDRDQYESLALEVMAEELKARRLTEQWMCPECGFLNPAGAAECTNHSSHEEADADPLPQPNSSSTQLGPDERKCPTCAEIIKREALKCRFCGQVLSAGAYGGAALGGAYGSPLSPEWSQFTMDEIESAANKGMWLSIVGIFCIFGLVCSPLGIYFSNQAIRLLDEHPEYERGTSARGKARAGQIIGWIIVGCYLIGILRILGMLANAH
jgi:predicted RNA-binding Zn-ribbon protein involved in translation (DUF1610 family)